MRKPKPITLQPTVNEALARLATWERAVRNQANRVLRAAPESRFDVSMQADCYLLVLALRNVLRAAKLVLAISPELARQEILAAVSTFEAAVLGAKNARDVLDHFDQYIRGQGDHRRLPGALPISSGRSGTDRRSDSVSP